MVDVTPLGNGRYRVKDSDRQSIAYAARSEDTGWIFLNGRVHVFDTTQGGEGRRAYDDGIVLASPMPAKVAAVKVTPGQQVTRNEVLLMLEAMKMELPIRAPRDGRVKAIRCAKGELVQPGIQLLELE